MTSSHREAFKITPDEKKAILAGDRKALRREEKPPVDAGQTLVLVWSRGGNQFVERKEEDRQEAAKQGTALTIAIPREPLVWLKFKEPRLKGDEWLLEFVAEDHRKPVRLLAPAPSPRKEPGLKTRWGQRVAVNGKVREKRVPTREEHREYWTKESERGYGSGGRSAVDECEGVDDATLDDFARRVAEENELRQRDQHSRASALSKENRIAREYRPQALSAMERRLKRHRKRLESPSDKAA